MLPIAGVLHLSTADVAKRLKVSESRIRQLKMAGVLHPVYVGSRTYFRPTEIDDFEAELELQRNRPLPVERSYYKPRHTARSRRKDYVKPKDAQRARRKRLVRVRVNDAA